MALFPSLLDLLIPNLNIFTVFGIIFIGLGVVSFIPQVMAVIKSIGLNPFSIGIASIVLGIVLIWGVSIVQDFLRSTGGIIIFWGALAVAFIGFALFYNPKKK